MLWTGVAYQLVAGIPKVIFRLTVLFFIERFTYLLPTARNKNFNFSPREST